MLKSLIVVSFLAMTSAFAAVDYNQILSTQDYHLSSIIGGTVTETGEKGCEERYDGLFSDGVLNITVGFGYLDAIPHDHVLDRYALRTFVNKIVQPCRPGISACGFRQSPTNPRLLTKTIWNRQGQQAKVQIDITTSSLSTSQLTNTTEKAARQKVVCEEATKKFFGEVAAGAEVVFYTGHSRDGGGIDFCPPVLTADGQHVNYSYYHKNRPGRKLMTSAMKKSDQIGKPNQVIGMFSCGSVKHFYPSYSSVLPNIGFLGSNATIMYSQIFTQMYSSLDSLLAQRCSAAFTQSLTQPGDFMILKNLF